MLHGVVGESLSALPNVGGPPPPISLPADVLIWAKPCTSPVAEATPGTACTVPISVSGIWSRVVLNPASTLLVERTNASVLANALAKIVSNVPRIVSLKTNTPDRNVVPAMIASAVSARRPLRARTFFSERRNMSLLEPLHPVAHHLGGRLGHLVDDLAVGQGDHAVGVAGRDRVVG